MSLTRLHHPWIAIAAIAGSLLAAPLYAAGPPAQGVRVTPIGSPTWAPVDFHMFTAPIGTLANGFAEFGETALALLPEPNHAFNPTLLVGPGIAHAPPYDTELRDGVAALGFREGVQFRVSDFTGGQGVWLVWMNVPAPGTTGESPDSTSGPIIPNALFPIHVLGTNRHNNKPFSILGEFDVPPLDASVLAPGFDGHSHFPLFFADSFEAGPPGAKLQGTYEFRIVLLDQSGSGWLVTAHYTLGGH